jgi:hypothetical protein
MKVEVSNNPTNGSAEADKKRGFVNPRKERQAEGTAKAKAGSPWSGSEMVFGWFKFEKLERRRKVRLDRKHLEARSRRFLKRYLNADETRKLQFYLAVEQASKQCEPVKSGLPPPELEDAQIAEATSDAAMKMVLAREAQSALKKDDRISDFVTDAYATVGIAYHRAAGVYTMDEEMLELGTAAVHLLTMATSYMRAHIPVSN